MSVIVIQFITLEGIVSGLDGSGGRAFRRGLECLSVEPAGAVLVRYGRTR